MNETKLELTTEFKSTEEIANVIFDVVTKRAPGYEDFEIVLATAKDGTKLIAAPNGYSRGFAVQLVRGTNRYAINGCKRYSELTLSAIMIHANSYVARFFTAPAAKATSRALDILGVI